MSDNPTRDADYVRHDPDGIVNKLVHTSLVLYQRLEEAHTTIRTLVP